MPSTIIFDLDNTLLDFWRFKRESAIAAAKAMRKHGWKLSEKETVKRIFAIYHTKGIEYQKTFAKLVYGQGYKGNEAERIQQAAILAYSRKKMGSLKAYPGIKQALSKLKKRGYKMAVLSDAPRNKAWQRLILTGLDKYFVKVGTFHDTGKQKPDKAPFLAMCKKLKAKPKECIFVGDNPERDIAGAKAVGMRTIWAKYGHVIGKKGYKADIVINKPAQLVLAVAKLGA